jgi:putative RNA 2'-phosphotransferase
VIENHINSARCVKRNWKEKLRKVRVSKFLSYILRHQPYKFGLQPDEYGFCDLGSVIDVMKSKFPDWDEEKLQNLIKSDAQKRFEIKDDKIRARYGHSINVKPVGDERDVPGILYHGTARRNVDSILKQGLKPAGRKFVHLSPDIESAIRVGKRHDIKPVILEINVHKAKSQGIKFWTEGKVVLSTEIPPDCIKIRKEGGER